MDLLGSFRRAGNIEYQVLPQILRTSDVFFQGTHINGAEDYPLEGCNTQKFYLRLSI